MVAMTDLHLPPALTDDLTSRPLRLADAPAVTAVMAAQELHDVGEVVIEEADIVAEWQRPSYDVGASSVGVFDGEQLVAYAELMGADRGDAAVHPDHRGRGLGTALARWMQEAARDRGSSVVGMPVPHGSAGDRLLEELGYHVRWTSWVLRLPAGTEVPDRPLPAGYTSERRPRPSTGPAGPCSRTPSSSGRSASVRASTTGSPRSPGGRGSSRGTCGS